MATRPLAIGLAEDKLPPSEQTASDLSSECILPMRFDPDFGKAGAFVVEGGGMPTSEIYKETLTKSATAIHPKMKDARLPNENEREVSQALNIGAQQKAQQQQQQQQQQAVVHQYSQQSEKGAPEHTNPNPRQSRHWHDYKPNISCSPYSANLLELVEEMEQGVVGKPLQTNRKQNSTIHALVDDHHTKPTRGQEQEDDEYGQPRCHSELLNSSYNSDDLHNRFHYVDEQHYDWQQDTQPYYEEFRGYTEEWNTGIASAYMERKSRHHDGGIDGHVHQTSNMRMPWWLNESFVEENDLHDLLSVLGEFETHDA